MPPQTRTNHRRGFGWAARKKKAQTTPDGVVWALGKSFFNVENFIFIVITMTHQGPQRPTKANAGQRRPTAANAGPRRQKRAQTTASFGPFRRFVTTSAGCTTSTTPLIGPDEAHESPRRPTQAHEEEKGPIGKFF